jgi:hypothetical protein
MASVIVLEDERTNGVVTHPPISTPVELEPFDPQQTRKNIIQTFLEEYHARKDEVDAQDWVQPEPEPRREWIANHRLEWREEPYPDEGDEKTSLKFARHDLAESLRRYMLGAEKPEYGLLVKGVAGLGKTHAGVHAAQEAAAQGRRVLWCGARHDSFYDLAGIEGFDREMWYNWLPIHKEDESEPSQPDEPMGVDLIGTTCRYAPEQHQWAAKGYKTIDLCNQLCYLDGHMEVCPFRKQADRMEPIVFARHAHLRTGLSAKGFDIVIVDEWPAQAFINRTLIPTRHILVENAEGAVHHFMATLQAIAESKPQHPIAGKELFDIIGPLLGRVYDEIDVSGEDAPVLSIVPEILHPSQVDDIPYFYIFDFLKLAMPEYRAWQEGWTDWVQRISVGIGSGGNGLHMLSRHEPWDDLPDRLVAFDATGTEEFYKPLFRREFETYAPDVPRMGKVYQVTGRQNGSGALIERPDAWKDNGQLDEPGELTAVGIEEMRKAEWIAQKYERGEVCAITLKGMRSHVEAILGTSNVMHFWGNRGANEFRNMRCLIQIGNPEPHPRAVQDMASILFPARMEPWPADGAEYQMVRFGITRELYDEQGGKMPYRRVLMFTDPQLRIVHEQLREMEQYQSLHRARPNVSDCEVWILNSTPSGEPVDGIYDRLPIGPDGIQWADWFKIEDLLEDRHSQGEPVTVADIASVTGRSETYIKRAKWLDKICSYKSDEWEIDSITPKSKGVGRRPKALRRRNR